MKSGKCLETFEGHEGWVQAVTIAGDTRFITGSGDRTAKLWDVETGKNLVTYKGHLDMVRSIAMIDDDRFITASDGKILFA